MLISEEYRQENKRLHDAGEYGHKGHIFAPNVIALSKSLGTTDVLDYGCGNHTLQMMLPFPIKEYDPCVAGYDELPQPAKIVICTDVLEHIELDCLDAVLDHLKSLTLEIGYFSIDTRPAQKFLSDGRNAHLIQERASWWFARLWERWASIQALDNLHRPEKSLGLIVAVTHPRSVPTTNAGRS